MIYLAGRAGYDYVSLRTIAMGLPGEPDFGLAGNRALLDDTRTALHDTGVRLLDIENARIHDGVDIERYLPEMEIAAELGARAVLTNVWSGDRSLVVDRFAELCDQARTFNLTVSLEFVTWASITGIRDAVELIRESRVDNAGVVVDLLHFNRSRCTVQELAALPPGLIAGLQICDAPAEIPATVEGLIHHGRAERLYPGEGGIDIAGVLKHAPGVVCGIEIPNLERAGVIGNAEHVFRCLERTRQYLAKHAL
jgi:sugar phosphate isomerase/epimerase